MGRGLIVSSADRGLIVGSADRGLIVGSADRAVDETFPESVSFQRRQKRPPPLDDYYKTFFGVFQYFL